VPFYCKKAERVTRPSLANSAGKPHERLAGRPDLPTRSDHARNGRFISDLQAYFTDGEVWKKRIDPTRRGLLGFSAGGLATLLSAADSPSVAIWVGLDPVDRRGLGAAVARSVQARAVVITADPSACNAYGNALDIVAALSRPEHFSIPGAVHVDAEWPTSWIAELICGRSTAERRDEFRRRATKALRETLQVPPLRGIRNGRRSVAKESERGQARVIY
jgi:hypothetical protein